MFQGDAVVLSAGNPVNGAPVVIGHKQRPVGGNEHVNWPSPSGSVTSEPSLRARHFV